MILLCLFALTSTAIPAGYSLLKLSHPKTKAKRGRNTNQSPWVSTIEECTRERKSWLNGCQLAVSSVSASPTTPYTLVGWMNTGMVRYMDSLQTRPAGSNPVPILRRKTAALR
ncbi:hypothetical protein PITC_052260 [Penicillium italicum]|uniref:Secreted protein n=1 Tax=Penicillium italicum TaxID=40296 RepID=A0A0A2KGK4_PENIT|nr:hypothetical protein PITC_052260 [Penicillium italicum]